MKQNIARTAIDKINYKMKYSHNPYIEVQITDLFHFELPGPETIYQIIRQKKKQHVQRTLKVISILFCVRMRYKVKKKLR